MPRINNHDDELMITIAGLKVDKAPGLPCEIKLGTVAPVLAS